MSKKDQYQPDTNAVRIQTARTNEMEHSTPMFLTSSFCFDNAEEMRATFADETDFNIYSRFSNPNVDEFVQKMCALEGAEAGLAAALAGTGTERAPVCHVGRRPADHRPARELGGRSAGRARSSRCRSRQSIQEQVWTVLPLSCRANRTTSTTICFR